MLEVVLRYPQFRRLWLAQVVSQAGDWLNRVAVLVLIGALSESTGEAALGMGALFALELALRLLPAAAFGPLAGPVADRVPRKALMVATDLLRAGVVLGLLLVREPGDLPLCYGLVVAQMSLGTFFNAARSASLPNTLPREALHAANALSSATWSLMLSVGALLGGVFVELVGVRGVFVIDAATYGVSALLLVGLRLPPVPQHAEPFRWRDLVLFTDLRRAWRHVVERRLAAVLLAKAFWGGGGGYLVVLSIAARERFGSAAGPPGDAAAAAGLATGLLYSARGLGTGLGPILGRALLGEDERALRRQIAGGFFVAAAGYALFATCRDLVPALACVVGAHLGGSALWVASSTLWQGGVDDAFRGRVFAMEFLFMTVAFTLGGLFAGAIHDAGAALEVTVWAVSALVVVLGLAWGVLARHTDGRLT